MPSKRLFMNKLNFDEIKTPFSIKNLIIVLLICNFAPVKKVIPTVKSESPRHLSTKTII